MNNNTKIISNQLLKKIKKDYIYNSYILQKFINIVMKNGEKSKAERIVYTALKLIKEKKQFPLLFLFESFELIRTDMEVIRKKLGKKIFFIPHPIKKERQYKVALKSLYKTCLRYNNGQMSQILKDEVFNIVDKKKSYSLETKKKLYEIAIFFRTHLHFRWK